MKDSKLGMTASTFILILILILSFFSTSFSQSLYINSALSPQSVNNTQKWGDSSIEEGMSTETILLIGLGTAAIIALIFLLPDSDEDNGNGSNEGKGEESDLENNLYEKNDNVSDGIPISLFQYNYKE